MALEANKSGLLPQSLRKVSAIGTTVGTARVGNGLRTGTFLSTFHKRNMKSGVDARAGLVSKKLVSESMISVTAFCVE